MFNQLGKAALANMLSKLEGKEEKREPPKPKPPVVFSEDRLPCSFPDCTCPCMKGDTDSCSTCSHAESYHRATIVPYKPVPNIVPTDAPVAEELKLPPPADFVLLHRGGGAPEEKLDLSSFASKIKPGVTRVHDLRTELSRTHKLDKSLIIIERGGVRLPSTRALGREGLTDVHVKLTSWLPPSPRDGAKHRSADDLVTAAELQVPPETLKVLRSFTEDYLFPHLRNSVQQPADNRNTSTTTNPGGAAGEGEKLPATQPPPIAIISDRRLEGLQKLSLLMKENNSELLLFDSQEIEECIVDDTQLLAAFDLEKATQISLTLESLSSIDNDNKRDFKSLSEQELSEVGTAIQKKIAASFGMPADRIVITRLEAGSVIVHFQLLDAKLQEKNDILTNGLKNIGRNFLGKVDLKFHPFFCSMKLDINSFDPRGDKDGFDGGEILVGPQGSKRTYYQPPSSQKWRRLGIRSLGRYENDEWLHPFHPDKIWYRAFHGTCSEYAKSIIGQGDSKAFLRESPGGKLGKGVYVSPMVEYAVSYSSPCAINVNQEKVEFVIIFQCAVRPGKILREGFPCHKIGNQGWGGFASEYRKRYKEENTEWTANSEDVRVYGLLILDIDEAKKICPSLSQRHSGTPAPPNVVYVVEEKKGV